MPGSPVPGLQGDSLRIGRGWLLFTMTGYRAALAAMDPKVESVVAPYMGKR
jgi:hypothetical protein